MSIVPEDSLGTWEDLDRWINAHGHEHGREDLALIVGEWRAELQERDARAKAHHPANGERAS